MKAEGLQPADGVAEQLSFDAPVSNSALECAADSVKARFCPDAVRFGTLLAAPPDNARGRSAERRDGP